MRALVLAFSSSLLAGCGLPVCPFGVGDCTPAEVRREVESRQSARPPTQRVSLASSVASAPAGGRIQFTARGGRAPYRFSIVSGGGSIGATDGAYIAAAPRGVTVVRVVDQDRNQADAAVIVE